MVVAAVVVVVAVAAAAVVVVVEWLLFVHADVLLLLLLFYSVNMFLMFPSLLLNPKLNPLFISPIRPSTPLLNCYALIETLF